MLTVAMSSSTGLVAVAVADRGTVLAQRESHTERRHAEEITPMLRVVLGDAGVAVGDLDRVVVDIGPGRYTGMRVGIATATTLAHALGIPVATVTSLELLRRAAANAGLESPAVPVVDARRDQVFAQIDDRALVCSPAELAAHVPPGATLVGDGADRYRDELAAVARVHPGIVPSVAAAALLAADWPTVDPIEVEPLYLREPDAAINIRTRPVGATPR